MSEPIASLSMQTRPEMAPFNRVFRRALDMILAANEHEARASAIASSSASLAESTMFAAGEASALLVSDA